MEQAGIYKITLYENKGFEIHYRPNGSIKTVSNTGETITLENADELTQDIELNIDYRRSDNNKLLYKHEINWKLLGLDADNIEKINLLKKSYYKFIPVIEYYNETQSILLNPVSLVNTSIDNNVSNSYNIQLNNILYGERLREYIPVMQYIFEDEIDYLFEDENIYIFD